MDIQISFDLAKQKVKLERSYRIRYRIEAIG